MALKRFVNGAEGEFFFQKRAPEIAARLDRDRRAVVPVGTHRGRDRPARRGAAGLDRQPGLHRPQPASRPRRGPGPPGRAARRPGSLCPACRGTTSAAWRSSTNEVLSDYGLVGWPKTSGSRGIHINVRIERSWTFDEVRRAALALAREVERRAPDIATSKWWKEERHGVFLDYNQNAKDRTVASAYSVRPLPDARVSMPLRWEQVADVDGRGLHAGDGTRHLRRATATRTPASTRRLARWTRCSSYRRATRARAWATRRGRPTTASRRASRRASSRRARSALTRTTTRPEPRPSARSRAPPWSAGSSGWPQRAAATRGRLRPRADAHRSARLDQAAHRDRARGQEGRGAWPGSIAGRRGIADVVPHSCSQPTCWSIRCAAGTRPGRGSGSTWSTCPTEKRPGAGATRGRLRPVGRVDGSGPLGPEADRLTRRRSADATD